MIRIEVEEYCHACMDFTPDVTPPVRSFSDDMTVEQTDTIVRCKHHRRCYAITRYLEQQMKGEASG